MAGDERPLAHRLELVIVTSRRLRAPLYDIDRISMPQQIDLDR